MYDRKRSTRSGSILERSDKKNLRLFEGCLSKFQFLLIDIANRLDQVSLAMLKALKSMMKESLLICPDTSIIGLVTLSEKTTFLFISSQAAEMIMRQNKQIGPMFILENDPKKVDDEMRFGSGLDLLFQLADEIYRCYMKEEREYANQIHVELKRIYNSISKDNPPSMEKSIDITTTAIVWLNMNTRQTTTTERLKKWLSMLVSSFVVFDDQITCEQYLIQNKSMGMVFLVINTEQQISFGMDFRELSNMKIIYYYEKASLQSESMITKYNDLCFRVISDLATHYNNLGSICSAKHDAKTAKDMFTKTYELYHILANLGEYQ